MFRHSTPSPSVMSSKARHTHFPAPNSLQTESRLKRKAASSNLSDHFEERPLDAQSGELRSRSAAQEALPAASRHVARESYHSLLPNKHSFAQVLHQPISLARENDALCKQTDVSAMPTQPTFARRADRAPLFILDHQPTKSDALVHPTSNEDNSVSVWASHVSPSWPLASTESTHQTTFGSNSNTSDPSISRFPLPPFSSDQTIVNRSQESRKAVGKETPIIYRTRGASFEFLNPRESLCLERIEAPTGYFTRSADYAEVLQQQCSENTRFNRADVTLADPFESAMDINRAHSTPPRSLFDDLHTAYSSITSRPVQKNEVQAKAKANNDLPLTPVPVKETKKSFDTALGSPSLQVEKIRPAWPQPTLSRKKRLSNLWRSNHRDDLSLGRDCDSDPGHKQLEPTSPLERPASAEKRLDFRRSVSEAEILRNKAQGMFPNAFHPDPAIRKSLLDLSNFDPASPESKIKNMIEREESTEALLSAYQYSFSDEVLADKTRRNEVSIVPHIQLQLPKDDGVAYSADSTIGDILEDYHRPDDSCTVPEEFLLDSDTRRFTYTKGDSFRTSSGISRVSDGHTDGDESKRLQPPTTTSHHDRDIRRATMQALQGLSDVGPSGPLPEHPIVGNKEDNTKLMGDTSADPFTSGSCLSSYGDTGNLLRGPSDVPPVEFGRGTAGSKSVLQKDLFSSSESFLAPLFKSSLGSKASPVSADLYNRDEVDTMVTRDIQHLSGLSGISGLSGSIYVLRTSSDGLGDVGRAAIDTEALKNEDATEKDYKNSASVNYVPQVAAFSQRSVKPGLRRLLSSDSLGNWLGGDRHSDFSLSSGSSSSHFDVLIDEDAEVNDDGEDIDWETLPETRDTRNTFMTGSSWEDCSSFSSNNNLSSGSLMRDDSRFRTSKRTGSPRDMEDFPLPTPDSRVVSGFPYNNSTKGRSIYSYEHPSPLSPSHENPFTSSPPLLVGSDSRSPSMTLFAEQGLTSPEPASSTSSTHKSIYQWHRPNLSVVYEATAEASGAGSPTKRPVTNVRSDENLSSGRDIRSYTSSAVLGSEPGPELSSEAVHGSPYDLVNDSRTYRPYGLSASDIKLVQRLRQNDPRMASSPLSDSNSFAKVAVLGPRLNITGTPDGTGMREVGSSVVASSSPFAITSSPPHALMPSTPLRSGTDGSQIRKTLEPHMAKGDSPLTGYDRSHAGLQSKVPDVDYLRDLEPTYPSAPKRTGSRGRSAVIGQTELKSLGLVENKITEPTPPKKVFFQRGPYAIPSGHQSTQSALAKFDIEDFTLKERYRSPSSQNSITKSRKAAISWFTFAACVLFPPLLVIYGLGYLDPGVAYLTKDEIRHFGKRPKKIAKWLGIVFTIVIVGAIIIFWIVVKTVPNNLPRK